MFFEWLHLEHWQYTVVVVIQNDCMSYSTSVFWLQIKGKVFLKSSDNYKEGFRVEHSHNKQRKQMIMAFCKVVQYVTSTTAEMQLYSHNV